MIIKAIVIDIICLIGLLGVVAMVSAEPFGLAFFAGCGVACLAFLGLRKIAPELFENETIDTEEDEI